MEIIWYGHSCFREIDVRKVFKIIAAAVFKQKKLLGDKIPALGDAVIFGVIFIEGLIDLFEYHGECQHLAYVNILICHIFNMCFSLFHPVKQIRIKKTVSV